MKETPTVVEGEVRFRQWLLLPNEAVIQFEALNHPSGERTIITEWIGPKWAGARMSGNFYDTVPNFRELLPWRVVIADYCFYTDIYTAFRLDGGPRAWLSILKYKFLLPPWRWQARYVTRALFRAGMMATTPGTIPRLRDIRWPSRARRPGNRA